MIGYKKPISVLVVVHTPALEVLLLERSAHPGYWQSVTGSQEGDESLMDTARREVLEETGLEAGRYILTAWRLTNTVKNFPEWRHRYAPGVTSNLEHVFGLQIPAPLPITVAPGEHLGYRWLPWRQAANECFSWSNRDAILLLPERTVRRG